MAAIRRNIAILILLCCACGRAGFGRMDRAEDPHGQYREQIEAAQRVLEQNENWVDRAEWEVRSSPEGWTVVAWRVEHPSAKGADRYLPWGYSIIELDRRFIALHYTRKG